jgi:Zn-dependent metalloprotease
MHNLTSEQERLLGDLRSASPDLAFEWDDARGVASFARGALSGGRALASEHPEAELGRFLGRFGLLFGAPAFPRGFRRSRERTDNLGFTHLVYQQLAAPTAGEGGPPGQDPVEVYGSHLAGHVQPGVGLIEVQSSCWRETKVDNELRVSLDELRAILARRAERVPGYAELERRARRQDDGRFPILQTPRLVLYPWKGALRLSWATYAYGGVELERPEGHPTGAEELVQGQAFVDAQTGEILIFANLGKSAETPDTGAGLAVTPIGGGFAPRTLNVVRVDGGSTYRLRDTTHARELVTYDSENSDAFNTDAERRDGLNAGTLPVSQDTDGNKNWDRTPASTTVAERTASQQPEVDLHFHIRDIYEWYDALAGGRAGWDDNQYANPPVPPQPIRTIAHAKDGPNPSSINAGERLYLVGGQWLAWLQFFDGDRVTYDYLAGSRFIVAHEYQHAITDFNVEDGAGNPGLTYDDWLAAVHEGISDVFGALYSEEWEPATNISPIGQIFRNIAYPRDDGPPPATAAWDAAKRDHFADRNLTTGKAARYQRGTILAHCAYLLGAGGVHQRAGRAPELIPVASLGRQTTGGRDVLRAARIWYRAYAYYFSTHGALSGIPANDENAFRTLRNGCVSAAADLYGVDSPEHRGTLLAFYAVGLHPAGTTYGPDPTFLRWGIDWQRSAPYIGLASPSWSSVDLFVNNGGASEWNALINVLDGGTPTDFENTVYCRVRNVGDQLASNVQIQFFYAKAGTAITTWLPVTDKNGTIQTLTVAALGAGQATFADSAQQSPPASAGVKWYIPPLASGETVSHFCLRAILSAPGDVNPHNNAVQSNISYAAYAPGGSLTMRFVAANPGRSALDLDLRVGAALPRGWRVALTEAAEGVPLRPGEERGFGVRIDMARGADQRLEAPFDGAVTGHVYGGLAGPFEGTLTGVRLDGDRLEGRLSGRLGEAGVFSGGLVGTLDVLTAEVKGRMMGVFQCGRGKAESVCAGFEGCLRPLRRVDVAQYADGRAIGGMTIQVQVPAPGGRCARPLPPTDTAVNPRGGPASRGPRRSRRVRRASPGRFS